MIGETSEKIVVPFVKIDESYVRTDDPALVLKNLRKIDVTSAAIGAIYGRITETCDTIVKTVAMTAGICGTIWAAEGTTVASRRLDTTKPAEASISAGSSVCQRRS